MCLIAIAHRASERFPLVIAANRDEEYERPSLPAAFWDGGAIVGGRDAVHGGSWLAITLSGRFAAVTNLRGSPRATQHRSRGELVSDFVRGAERPLAYLNTIASRASEYGGFHLLAGEVGGELAQLSGSVAVLEPGVHGLSNAPDGVRWPKVDVAVASLGGALECSTSTEAIDHLFRLLRQAPTHADPTRDLFIAGERYGTRASTVIVFESNEVRFVERTFGRGGVATGEQSLRFIPRR